MLQKLALLIVLIAAAWMALTWLTRVSQRRRDEQVTRRGGPGKRGADPQGSQMKVEDMVRCPRCGDYQAESALKKCQRSDCPYP